MSPLHPIERRISRLVELQRGGVLSVYQTYRAIIDATTAETITAVLRLLPNDLRVGIEKYAEEWDESAIELSGVTAILPEGYDSKAAEEQEKQANRERHVKIDALRRHLRQAQDSVGGPGLD